MDPKPALAIVREGRGHNPRGAQLALLDADLCLRLRRPDEAVAAFKAALPLLPTDAASASSSASCSAISARSTPRSPRLRDAVAVDATNASAWNALGMTLGGSGRLDEAEKAFRAGDCAQRHGSPLSLQSRARPRPPGPRRRGAAVLRTSAAARARLRRRRETSFASWPPNAADRTMSFVTRPGCSAVAASIRPNGTAAGARGSSRRPRRAGAARWIAFGGSVARPASGRAPSSESAARLARHRPRGSSRQLSLRRGADAADRRAGERPACDSSRRRRWCRSRCRRTRR